MSEALSDHLKDVGVDADADQALSLVFNPHESYDDSVSFDIGLVVTVVVVEGHRCVSDLPGYLRLRIEDKHIFLVFLAFSTADENSVFTEGANYSSTPRSKVRRLNCLPLA